MKARFAPAGRLSGQITPPADKSISHRAALLGAMSSGPVRIGNYLHAADTTSTLQAIQALGALVEVRTDAVVVRGPGMREADAAEIDVGNAGTLMRLLPGWLVAQRGRRFVLDGDASIRRRPVDRVAEPLRLMGARVQPTRRRFPPLVIEGGSLRSIAYELPMASAQVKSCILLAALGADGASTVGEPAQSRDHTERMLKRSGAVIHRHGRHVTIANTDELALTSVDVPGDLSSAAFLVTAGVLVRGSRLIVRDVGVNWTRSGFLRILQRMGAIVLGDLEPAGDELVSEEPTCDLDVAAGPLVGTVVEAAEVPLAIDELPLVALLGCFAEGETIVRGAGELRLKESDRIAAVVKGLRGLGADIAATEDGFVVQGAGGLRGGAIASGGDHRMAMMGAVAGLASRDGVEVDGMEAAAVSYPGFATDLTALAAR